LTSTHTTSFLETGNSSILSQRCEIASTAEIGVVDDEFMELDPSALDMTALEMSHEQVRQGPKTKRKVKNKKRSLGQIDVNDHGEEFVPDKKPRRKQAPKPEPVYVIPDVERKETTFRGRLGPNHLFLVYVCGLILVQVMLVSIPFSETRSLQVNLSFVRELAGMSKYKYI